MAVVRAPDEVLACWRAAASMLRAAPHPDGMGFSAGVEGVRLIARDAWPDLNGTFLEAQVPPPPGLRLRVRHGYVYPIGRALGVQNVGLGDPEFDDRFVVKANDEEYARAWLGPMVRERILAAPEYGYEIGPGFVGARREGVETDARLLRNAAMAVVALARQGERLLDVWAEVAETLGGRVRVDRGGWRPDGSVAIEVEQAGASGTVDSILGDRPVRLLTRVSSRRVDVGDDAFALALRDGGGRLPSRLAEIDDPTGVLAGAFRVFAHDSARLARRLDAPLRAALLDLRPPLVIFGGDSVEIRFAGWLADGARLRAALEITSALADAPEAFSAGGPYR